MWLFQFSHGGGLVALWVLMDLGPREMGPTKIIRVAFFCGVGSLFPKPNIEASG
jgi:hypothetical protein